MDKQPAFFLQLTSLSQKLVFPVLIFGTLIWSWGQFTAPYDVFIDTKGVESIVTPNWIIWTDEMSLTDFHALIICLLTATLIGSYLGFAEQRKNEHSPLALLILTMCCVSTGIKIGIMTLAFTVATVCIVYLITIFCINNNDETQ